MRQPSPSSNGPTCRTTCQIRRRRQKPPLSSEARRWSLCREFFFPFQIENCSGTLRKRTTLSTFLHRTSIWTKKIIGQMISMQNCTLNQRQTKFFWQDGSQAGLLERGSNAPCLPQHAPHCLVKHCSQQSLNFWDCLSPNREQSLEMVPKVSILGLSPNHKEPLLSGQPWKNQECTSLVFMKPSGLPMPSSWRGEWLENN